MAVRSATMSGVGGQHASRGLHRAMPAWCSLIYSGLEHLDHGLPVCHCRTIAVAAAVPIAGAIAAAIAVGSAAAIVGSTAAVIAVAIAVATAVTFIVIVNVRAAAIAIAGFAIAGPAAASRILPARPPACSHNGGFSILVAGSTCMPGHCPGRCVELDSVSVHTLIGWDLAGSLAAAFPLPGGINFNHSLRGGGALAGPAEAPHQYAFGVAG